ncbi:hypothetical protein A3H38_00160 [candidate division WOR-1 bacterium RIFCSPLOWO2_02_FULL_46_20]|uniref:Peptidase M20 dimerisation domain-containing protein n=1 Tax=candidate division WOR-1 bacterium RIFCSPLOWO2_02_FULL_46_20 TaxID=1802567 RepID=A0A1F4R4K7_UNCSA|nr:MAG: hypothetical protein A3J44_06575 [candidate division WOR-1 bacterium RIFCSPHIGHO2_02_FULL_45_12]OGC03171.1 MAG: hypothetical protein A3H38_00160 [candidate division WOR-1 bacterium RIFCSPLOWO2_02_FULL_46_20]
MSSADNPTLGGGSPPILKDLKVLVNTSSETNALADITRAARVIKKLFKPFFEIREYPTPLGPVICCQPAGQAAPILMVAHYDTVVPVSRAGGYREEGNKVFGAGISDMKAGIAMAAALAKRYKIEGRAIPFGVIIVPDEEIGSPESAPILRTVARSYRLALILEPVFTTGQYVMSRRGLTKYNIEIIGKTVHTGLSYERADAMLAAAQIIVAVSKRHDPQRYFSTNLVIDPLSLVGKINAVEGRVKLSGEIRTGSETDQQGFFSWLREFISTIRIEGVTLQLVVPEKGQSSPVTVGETAQRYERVLQEVMTGQGIAPDCVPAHERGASDLNRLTNVLPAIDGLGAVGFGAHSTTEWIDRLALAERTKLLWELTNRLSIELSSWSS